MEKEFLDEYSPLENTTKEMEIEKYCKELIDSFRDIVSQSTLKDENKKALQAAIIYQTKMYETSKLFGKNFLCLFYKKALDYLTNKNEH